MTAGTALPLDPRGQQGDDKFISRGRFTRQRSVWVNLWTTEPCKVVHACMHYQRHGIWDEDKSTIRITRRSYLLGLAEEFSWNSFGLLMLLSKILGKIDLKSEQIWNLELLFVVRIFYSKFQFDQISGNLSKSEQIWANWNSEFHKFKMVPRILLSNKMNEKFSKEILNKSEHIWTLFPTVYVSALNDANEI